MSKRAKNFKKIIGAPYYRMAEMESTQRLVEDTWSPWVKYNPMDKGVGYLRYIMDNVKPSEIWLWDLHFVVTKYTILSAAILAGMLSQEFFQHDDSILLGRYLVELTKILDMNNIEINPEIGGITENGWETFHAINEGSYIAA